MSPDSDGGLCFTTYACEPSRTDIRDRWLEVQTTLVSTVGALSFLGSLHLSDMSSALIVREDLGRTFNFHIFISFIYNPLYSTVLLNISFLSPMNILATKGLESTEYSGHTAVRYFRATNYN